ncbi:hypothetical protein [Legionella yabuuchiae]|uniref:hypothetical protein n=1 Tax=Legionella yabuuchiae TaxID=376727 RepID=UPI0013EF8977|nr:hypothetical protein [Legionella yabuuchiae]
MRSFVFFKPLQHLVRAIASDSLQSSVATLLSLGIINGASAASENISSRLNKSEDSSAENNSNSSNP